MSNPIAIGFVWRQAFDFTEGFFQPGDRVRAEFREYARDRNPLATVSDGAGTRVEGSRLFVELSETQTAGIKTDVVVTNFVVERAGDEILVGAIVTVPVVLLPTRPLP